MNNADFLKQYQSKEWYETSKRIKARDHNTCQMCGRNDVPLSVHHLYYDAGSIFIPDDAMITLCEECHKKEQFEKDQLKDTIDNLRYMFTSFELTFIFEYIINHFSSYRDHPLNETIKPDKIPNDSDDNIVKLNNLYEWRKRIRYDEVQKGIVDFYFFELTSGLDTTNSEYKFMEEFGYPIKDYIEANKEYCKVLEERWKKSNENTIGNMPF